MKMKMADTDVACFNIGMLVSCKTCHGQTIQGEVIAFDYASKTLALKSTPVSGKAGMHDVRILNLNFIGDVEVLKEASEQPSSLQPLNIGKIHARSRKNREEKDRQANYIGVGVTPQAQKLFHTITKTINEVKWDGQNIIVLDDVTIRPPYQIDNCTSCSNKDSSSGALAHVRKIVERYHADQGRASSASPSS